MQAHPDQPWGNITYSQFGEDLILINLFSVLDGGEKPITYIDVGANHPQYNNNTYLFYSRGKSHGILVEPNPDLTGLLSNTRPKDIILPIAVVPDDMKLVPSSHNYYMIGAPGRNSLSKSALDEYFKGDSTPHIQKTLQVSSTTLDNILDSNTKLLSPSRDPNDYRVDLLSLDAEGLDYDILAQSQQLHKIRVICVETVSTSGRDLFSQFRDMMQEKGFSPYCRTWGNTIFIRQEEAHIWT